MPLTPGTKLGPYEVLTPLGAGGMGEVYRARDTRLEREVAIKVLPEHLSAHPEIRARFEREAKTVSSLNHPNICTLFDVGREGDIDYLVMELIEGETLADRLCRGALPTTDVLSLGVQIADALDQAHRAGVMHRDLKPGNVMLTRSGAKLMDFGLARATGLAGAGGASGLTQAALTRSPTMAQPLTAEGTIVGTFQYMAPEQLEGKEVDARADLWALGCVLHEMATGRRAFDGASQASLIASIMHVAPAPVSQVAPLSPPALDRVVSACLAKNPAERIQSAHDVKLQLGWIAEGASQPGAASRPEIPATRPGRGALFSRLAFLVGLVGLTAAAMSGLGHFSRKSLPMSLQVPMPADLHLRKEWSAEAISPDGNFVIAGGASGSEPQRLWLWRLASAEPVALPGTEGGYYPVWSPDGRSLAYFNQQRGGLVRLPIAGGSPEKICNATALRGMSWGKKGVIVFSASAAGPIYRVPADGGEPVEATALDSSLGEASHRFPCFLPDGEHFLYAALPRGAEGYTIYAGSLSSKARKRIMVAECAPVYAEPGYLVFLQGGQVTTQRFDAARLEPVGERVAIAQAPLPSDLDAEPVATASKNGRLLYPAIVPLRARVEWLDRKGAASGILSLPEGAWNLSALSPDQGTAIAVKDRDLWQVDLGRSVATRLAHGIRPDVRVAFSPDGRRVALDMQEKGRAMMRTLSMGGSGAMDSVHTPPVLFQEVADWAPDGASLLVAQIGGRESESSGNHYDLWIDPLVGGGSPRPYLATQADERTGRISPDGKWVACSTLADGQQELFIDSYPVAGHRVQVLSGEVDRPIRVLWGRGGRELLYTDSQGDLISLPLEYSGDQVRPGRPARLFHLPTGLTGMKTRDGERFLVSVPSGATPEPALRLILDWTGLAKK